MTDWLITNAEIVNEGRREIGDVSIRDGRIHRIGRSLPGINPAAKRRHHGWDIGRGLAVPCDLVHAHTPRGKA